MMHPRKGLKMSSVIAATIMTFEAQAQDIEVHYCIDPAESDQSRLGAKASRVLAWPGFGGVEALGTVTFTGGREIHDFREAFSRLQHGSSGQIEYFLHDATELGNAAFSYGYLDASTWEWSEFSYEHPEAGSYGEGPSVVVRAHKYKLEIEDESGVLYLEGRDGRLGGIATYECVSISGS
ncbi:MAG: hypothetical protein F4145_17640 [Boseongicola sp. SB0675_bin_26]|nr:hypothetical protein [Boseongicola sp. SB0675_bin_26]